MSTSAETQTRRGATTRGWLYVSVTGATGVAVLAVSSALSAVSWEFVELPAADNSIFREATLALFGFVFLGLSVAGSAVVRRRPVPDGARPRFGTAAVVLSMAALAVAVVGAGRFAAHAAVDQLRAVLDDTWLNLAGSNGIVILLVALGLSGAGLVALALGGPARR